MQPAWEDITLPVLSVNLTERKGERRHVLFSGEYDSGD